MGRVLVAGGLSLAAVTLVALPVGPPLPSVTEPPLDASSPHVTGDVGVLVPQLVGAVLYVVAATLFTASAERHRDDPLLRWLGPAMAVSAWARVNYFLFPSLYSSYVYAGDVLRAVSCAVLVGATKEIGRYWAQTALVATLEERRRLARDLHDGLAQELAYMWSQLRRLSSHPDDTDALARTAGAAERALDESLRAIAALTRPLDEPLDVALAQSAEDIAARYGATVALTLDPHVSVDEERREAMIRIVREAVGNAVRHGGTDRVEVTMVLNGRLELTIADRGSGFDPASPGERRTGFGLTSMRQRAEVTGGHLTVTSRPGKGTTVLAVWDD